MSEKTEQPTPKRLRDARRRGDLAKSKPLAAAASLAGGLAGLAASLPQVAAEMTAHAGEVLASAGTGGDAFGPSVASAAIARAAATIFQGILWPVIGAVAGSFVGAALQVGLLLNLDSVKPKLERLDPASGLKRLCSARAALEAVRSALLAAVALAVGGLLVKDRALELARLPTADALTSFARLIDLADCAAARLLIVVLAFGGVDYLLQRRAHLRRLRMSRQEVKQEYKDSEGDPQHKARRKALHRALLQGSAARGVQRAKVVIVNPTHVAVALRYEPREAEAPVIVAKGIEARAAHIRRLAALYRVPIVRDVPLARALVQYDLGDEVPEELYQAAAAVLRKVYELDAAPSSTPGEPR